MKHTYKKNEDAVSPVIGVILMVCITVVLAAIVASFVFGMTSGMTKTKVVGITAEKVTGGITFTNHGGADVSRVSAIALDATDDSAASIAGTLGKTVGSKATVTGTFTGNNQVVVVGTFDDGTTQVLLSTYL